MDWPCTKRAARRDPSWWAARLGVLPNWKWEYGFASSNVKLKGHVALEDRVTHLNRKPISPDEAFHEALETALIVVGCENRTLRDALVVALSKLVL